MPPTPRKFDPEEAEFVQWYAGLFRHSRRHRKLIATLLRKQVQGRARFTRFPPGYRADVMQDTTIHAMRQVGKYRPSEGSPISYFDKIIDRFMRKEVRKIRRQSSVVVQLPAGVEPKTLHRPDGLAAARVEARAKKTPTGSKCPRVRHILTERVKNTVEKYNRASEDQQQTIRIILATLQDVHREVVGRFIPVRTDGIQYSESHRLHELGAA